eukprot:2470663-Rhodomonas_salina.1
MSLLAWIGFMYMTPQWASGAGGGCSWAGVGEGWAAGLVAGWVAVGQRVEVEAHELQYSCIFWWCGGVMGW